MSGFSLTEIGFFVDGAGAKLAPATGTLVVGYAGTADDTLQCAGQGGFVHGYSFANGYATGIYADGSGSQAFGKAYSVGATAKIYSAGTGSQAFGSAIDYDISSTGAGSFAGGYASNGDISSSSNGAFAHGYTKGYAITASGEGSFAQGYSDTAAITASVSNSAQFGPGTNAQTDSLQVGATMRLKGTTGAPSSNLHDGDQWVANSHQYQRSNGISHKVTPRFGYFAYADNGTVSIGSGYAGIVFGYAATDSSYIKSGAGASHQGTLAGGNAYSTGDGYAAKIAAANNGAVAIGYAKSYNAIGKIRASAAGSVAHGTAYGDASNSYITSSAEGAFAMGYARDGGNIAASGVCAFAMGYADGVNITASGVGAHASGYAKSYDITATAYGAFAHGYAANAAISATANNAGQFGEGVNSVADSTRFGTGIRLFHGGVPGAPANGDAWVSGGSVFFRTNGVTKNLDNI